MVLFGAGFVLGTVTAWVALSLCVLSGRSDAGNEIAWAKFQTFRLRSELQRILDSSGDSRVASCLRQVDAIAEQLA